MGRVLDATVRVLYCCDAWSNRIEDAPWLPAFDHQFPRIIARIWWHHRTSYDEVHRHVWLVALWLRKPLCTPFSSFETDCVCLPIVRYFVLFLHILRQAVPSDQTVGLWLVSCSFDIEMGSKRWRLSLMLRDIAQHRRHWCECLKWVENMRCN